MFGFPQLAVLLVSAAMTVAYFIMMMPRFDLKLWLFLAISLAFTAAQAVLFVYVRSPWIWYGGLQCAAFDLGAAVQLACGRRTVRDVMGDEPK